MNIRELNLGDLSAWSPYRDTPGVGSYEETDLVVLKMDGPSWLFVKVFDALRRSGAGAIALPAPGGAMVAWSRGEKLPSYDFIADGELETRLPSPPKVLSRSLAEEKKEPAETQADPVGRLEKESVAAVEAALAKIDEGVSRCWSLLGRMANANSSTRDDPVSATPYAGKVESADRSATSSTPVPTSSGADKVDETVKETKVASELNKYFSNANLLNETKQKIRARQKLTEKLWEYRELIVTPSVWSGDQNNSKALILPSVKLEKDNATKTPKTFQDEVRDLKHQKIQIEYGDHSRRIIFHISSCPSIGFFVKKGGRYVWNYQNPLNKWDKSDIKRFFGGGWFEEFVYLLLDSQKEKNGQASFLASVNVSAPPGELDVVSRTDKGRFFILECKTGANLTHDYVETLEKKVQFFRSRNKGNNVPDALVGVFVCLNDISNRLSFLENVRASKTVACVYGASIPTLLASPKFRDIKAGEILH